MQRITISDIARAAGVSLGTASKVLNADPTVKPKNREAVEQAISDLGYSVNKLARSLAHKPIKLGIVLPSAFDAYFSPMAQGVRRVVDSLSDYKVYAVYKSYEKFDDDHAIADCLEYFAQEDVSGIVLGPIHRMGGYCDYLSAFQACKIPVVLVLSDLRDFSRIACVSIDAALSGATAAELAALAMPPDTNAAVLVGNKDVAEHREKAESFCLRMSQLTRGTVDVFETQDEPDVAYMLTRNMIRNNPKLRAVYVATGNSVAVCKAICDCDMQDAIRVVVTDLLDGLEPYIQQGIVIGSLDQHFEEQGATAVTTLYRYLTEGVLEDREIKIAPSVLLPSSMLNQLHRKK